MSKDSYYFSHDSNAHTDPKIIDLLMDLKAEGYGVYWVILEMLRNENGYKLSNQDYNAIAYMAHSTAEVVEKASEQLRLKRSKPINNAAPTIDMVLRFK